MSEVKDCKYRKHQEKAMELFKSGCNCAQAVLGAFTDETNMDMEFSLRMASSFGGGMGRLREVCGAVSAMFMIAGIKYGYSDLKDKEAKDNHYKLIQDLAEKFKSQAGSIICRELLNLPDGADNPISAERTKEYYSKRPCEELCGLAAKIIDENL